MGKSMRFKADINDGEVTLDIRSGQTIQHSWSADTDEGFCGGQVTFEACDSGITRTLFTDGRDCDGYQSSESVDFCPWAMITRGDSRRRYVGEIEITEGNDTWTESLYEVDPGWPAWKEVGNARHYDKYAEAMNY